jgi:translation initiation factor 1
MAKGKKLNNLSDLGGFVYSTNPNFESESEPEVQPKTNPKDMQLRIWLQKLKGNKVVSVVKGFEGSQDEAKDLATKLKNLCGAGGSVKNDEIIIQGDQRNKILDYLKNTGFSVKKAGG